MDEEKRLEKISPGKYSEGLDTWMGKTGQDGRTGKCGSLGTSQTG